jgi:dihydropyrimidinase
VGADADFALFDPAAHSTLTHSALHDGLDYTPYEGMALDGALVCTVLRGGVVFERGSGGDVINARRGQGQFLASGAPDLLGWAGELDRGGDSVLDKASRL